MSLAGPRDLVVLGSGTALSTADRGPSGYLLRFGDGSGLLLDAGPGSVRAAARHGVAPERLRGALITHLHPDHTADLIALLFARRSPLLRPLGPLHLAGPAGLRGLCRGLVDAWGDSLRCEPAALCLRELDAGRCRLELDGSSIDIEAVSMPHLTHSLGYRLSGESGRVLAYSGDTGWGDGPLLLGREVDTYLLEAALPEGDGSDGHLTPRLAGRVAHRCGCRRLVITHLYPRTAALDLEAEVRREYPGELLVAADGMVLEI